MARKDAIKLALVLAAIVLAAYGTWRAARWIELRIALSTHTDGFFYPASTDDVAHLLDLGANPNTRNGEGGTVLHVAVSRRDTDIVRVLLEGGADPRLEDGRGFRPIEELHYADDPSYTRRDLALAKLLWEHGEAYTFLDAVATRDDAFVLAELQRTSSLAKQSIRGQSHYSEGMTTLMAAARYGSQAAFDALLAAGAEVNAADDAGTTVMAHAATRPGAALKILPKLSELGAQPDVSNKYGRAPLGSALQAGNAKEATYFIEHGADVNRVDRDGVTPLMLAAVSCAELVVDLVERGAALDARNNEGRTALALAVSMSRYESARMLLEAGADPNAKDQEGRTPIWSAVQEAFEVEMFELLAQHGADLTLRDQNGNNLFVAVGTRHYPADAESLRNFLRLLIRNGVSLDDVNNAGESAREWALFKFTAEELAELEREAPAISTKPNAGDNELKPE